MLSGNGAILMQERTSPVPHDMKLPRRIPALLGDLKRDNFGLLKGRVVAHDYGTSQITMAGMKSIRASAAKLVKAEWW